MNFWNPWWGATHNNPYTNFHELNMDYWLQKVRELEERVDNIEKRLDSIKDEIKEEVLAEVLEEVNILLNEFRTEINNTLNEFKTEVTNLIDIKISTALGPIIERLTNVETKVNEIQTKLDECCKEVKDSIDNIRNDITNINTSISNIETNITNIENDIDEINTKIETIIGDIGEVGPELNGIKQDIADIKERLTTVEGKFPGIESDIDDLDTRVTALEQGGGTGATIQQVVSLYIASTGNDTSGTGTTEKPFRTVSKCIATASSLGCHTLTIRQSDSIPYNAGGFDSTGIDTIIIHNSVKATFGGNIVAVCIEVENQNFSCTGNLSCKYIYVTQNSDYIFNVSSIDVYEYMNIYNSPHNDMSFIEINNLRGHNASITMDAKLDVTLHYIDINGGSFSLNAWNLHLYDTDYPFDFINAIIKIEISTTNYLPCFNSHNSYILINISATASNKTLKMQLAYSTLVFLHNAEINTSGAITSSIYYVHFKNNFESSNLLISDALGIEVPKTSE